MSVNTDQAIFDAIAAATRVDCLEEAVVINVQKFIDTFNGHRDRKLCTSLDSYEVTHLKAMLANEHQKTVPVEERNRIAQTPVYAAMEAALEMSKPGVERMMAAVALVKRLNVYGTGSPDSLLLMREAVARIEALEAALREILEGHPDAFDLARAALGGQIALGTSHD